ncbi:hypothetical protein ACEPPN_012928 [Leptodophora sp. 'Broadleaf-Isolate-01']
MAGPSKESLDEVHILVDATLFLSEDPILNPNHVQPDASSAVSTTTFPGNALITHPPSHLDLRQNNPQDCQNLIIASVDRATVEISRTIIALNATFSQQVQEASISASNGIKAAQDSASSSIGIVVKSADAATSSASFSLTIANRQVVSATSALADFSLSSSSDVASLSSSLSLLQASLTSAQASASAAIAAAQIALASATGSAAAQASSLLASANANLSPSATQTSSSQPLPSFQSPPGTSLTPAQIAGIAIGAAVASVLLGLVIYFAILRLRRRDRDSYLNEKYNPRSPRELPSRSSSTLRTGNRVALKFNPPKSSDAPRPSRSALRTKVRGSIESPPIPRVKRDTHDGIFRDNTQSTEFSNSSVWPLSAPAVDSPEQQISPPALTHWPLKSASVEQSVSITPTVFSECVAPVTRDRVVGSPYDKAGEDENVTNPFSDQLELPDDEQVPSMIHETPTDEVKATRDIFEYGIGHEDFNFGVLKAPFNEPPSDVEVVPEADNPFSDTRDEVVDESWDEFNYSLVEKFIAETSLVVGDTGAGLIQDNEHQHIDVETKQPTDRNPERVKIPLGLPEPQSYPATLPEVSDMLGGSTVKTIPGTNTSIGKDNYTVDQPAFLQNYSPPMPTVEKIAPPPPRRRPSLGSVRPLRKMLPPRQKTVSPQRRSDMSMDGRSNPSPANASSARPEVKSLSLIPKSTQSEQPGPLGSASVAVELRESALSPLRRNPVIVDILTEASVAQADNNSGLPSQHGVEATKSEDRQHRGRSMLRTSDVIEARLSLRSQMAEERKSLEALQNRLSTISQQKVELTHPLSSENHLNQDHEPENDAMKSPLRRNPVDFSTIPRIPLIGSISRSRTLPPLRKSIMERNAMRRRSRSLSPQRPLDRFIQLNSAPSPSPTPMTREDSDSPLRRNPIQPLITTSKRRSRTLSPNPLLNPFRLPLPHPPPLSREVSPLPLNPSQPLNQPPSPLINESHSQPPKPHRNASNGLFAQSLSKFQNLAALNPQDSLVASTEVTQRAIAGIYIPGSLREEAVRGVSRSRER